MNAARADNRKIKIVFWGTSEFAIPALAALCKDGRHIAAVVANPDEPAARRHIITPPPVKAWALARALKVLQPTSPTAIEKELRDLAPDLFIVAAYGKLIPKKILDISELGALNIHPSLLPRWRGPAPIQYAILEGDAKTGVTIMQMDEQMDHGPIVAQRELAISKIKYKDLRDALAGTGAELLIETLPRWIRGELKPVPQDESHATYSKILTREDGRIDWSKPAEEIGRMVRALNPWPGAWTVWTRDGKQLRVRVEEADATPDAPPGGMPGLVWQDINRPLLVKNGRGSLVIQKLGVEGKNILDADTFVRGYQSIIGAALG